MAKSEGRGFRSFIPSLRGVVKILIVLCLLKVVLSFVSPRLPISVQPYVPVF